jgi:hypothetical protein
VLPPAARFAAVETDYTASRQLWSADLRAAFNSRLVGAGWQPNGGWDDRSADAAYANYCQKISGTWAALSMYRGPASNGMWPLQIVIEGYPQASGCPGRPADG